MKKISLLAIASFVSVLAFSQAAATQATPGKTGKYVNSKPVQDQPVISTFTNAAGIQPASVVAPGQKVAAVKTKAAVRPAKDKTVATY